MILALFPLAAGALAGCVEDAPGAGEFASDSGLGNDSSSNVAALDSAAPADTGAAHGTGAAKDTGAADDTGKDAANDTASQPDTAPPEDIADDDAGNDAAPQDTGTPPECTIDSDCNGKFGLAPCQSPVCAQGKCYTKYLPDNAACDDNDQCSQLDSCQKGKCKGAKALDCDDANPCTSDECKAATGCAHLKLTASKCDDGNPCTTGDLCDKGACSPGSPTACNDNKVCTDDSCDAAKGCVYAPKSSGACSDNNKCTVGDACSAGACQGKQELSCDDGNPCTADKCATQTGCANVPELNKLCDDGNKCTNGDKCTGGKCAGQGKQCDDGNPCTSGGCEGAGECKFSHADGKACSDNNKCTLTDKCNGGGCKGEGAVKCDDGKACTQDSCDKAKGCVFTMLNSGACEDGDPCTVDDKCSAGKCAAVPKPCDDGDKCTGNLCSNGKCFFPNISGCEGAKCTMGSQCTSGDKCVAPACVGGKCLHGKVNCDDGNACTKDTCEPKSGCKHVNDDSAFCGDGVGCTIGGQCSAGKCQGGKPRLFQELSTSSSSYSDRWRDVLRLSDGSYMLVGNVGAKARIARHKPSGEQWWKLDVGQLYWQAERVALASDGTLRVIGRSQNAGPGLSDAWISKVSIAGAQGFSVHVGSKAHEYVYDGVTAGLDTVFVGEFDGTPGKGRQVWLGRVDSAGKLIWNKEFGESGNDLGKAIVTDPAGGWWIGAHLYLNDKNTHRIYKVNAQGAEVWQLNIGGMAMLADMRLTGSGQLVIAGAQSGSFHPVRHGFIGLVQPDASKGTLVWSAKHGTQLRWYEFHGVTEVAGGVVAVGMVIADKTSKSDGLAKSKTACDDGKVCTADTCHPADGCKATNFPNQTKCADGKVCLDAKCQ